MQVRKLLPTRQRTLALAAGLIFPLSVAPFFFWPLSVICLIGLLFCLQDTTPREAAIRTWWFALGKFLVGVSWIYVSMHDHGGTPAILAAAMVTGFSAFLATFPMMFMYWFQKEFNTSHTSVFLKVFAFASLWFLYEWFRSWFLTGFPWLFAGDAHLHTWLSGWAPVLSVYGLSFFTAITAGVIYYGFRQKKPLLLILMLIWPAGYFLQKVQWTTPGDDLVVSAVQGNIPQERKWLREQFGPTLNTYLSETHNHWDSDLILWPETAVTIFKDQFQSYLDGIGSEAEQRDTTLITGIPFRYTEGHLSGEFHNSVIAIGKGDGVYHKQKLVPFGEYVPLADMIRGLLPFFDLPMSSFRKGDQEQALLKMEANEQLHLIAPFICYEIVYPQLVSSMADESDMLITISNDAWFGDSLGPKQHMAIAQMRALETQRWLLRSTNTGITALVNPEGDIVSQLPVKQVGTLTGTAQARTGHTPFMAFGLWPMLILAVLVLIAGRIFSRIQSTEQTKTAESEL